MNQRLVTITGISIIALVLAIITFVNIRQARADGEYSASLAELDTNGQPMLGRPDAPVTILSFDDFTCPHCRIFNEEVLPRLKREFIDSGQAKLYSFNFSILGDNSNIAAMASECAYQQDSASFWDYKTLVMRAQGSDIYSPEALAELARDYVPTLDANALEQCIREERTREQINQEATIARSASLDSTPVVVVNGTIANNYTYDIVSQAIRDALGE